MALEVYHKMNTGWTDSSGNGRDITISGAVINTVDQKLGDGCGDFDGVNNEGLYAGSYYDFSGTTEFTIEGWIKADAGFTTIDTIYSQYNNLMILSLQTNHLAEGLVVTLGAANDFASFSQDIHTDWVYVAMVYNGNLTGNANRLKLNVNGIFETINFHANANIPAVVPTINQPPQLGSTFSLGRYWEGLLDDMAIYSHALTQDEIDYRYNGGAGREISFGSSIRKKKLMEMYNA